MNVYDKPYMWELFFSCCNSFIGYYCMIFIKKSTDIWYKNIPKNTLLWICHKGVSYTMFISFGWSIYECWGDIFIPVNLGFISGLGLLSVASYLYHSKSCEYIERQRIINYQSVELCPFFIRDILSIHVFSYTCLVTNYSYEWGEPCLFYSGCFHLLGGLWNVYNTVAQKKELYDGAPNTAKYILSQYLFVSNPAFLDIVLICFHSNTIYGWIGLNCAIYIGLLLVIMPFYDITHIFVHIFLLWMNRCLLKCNHSLHV